MVKTIPIYQVDAFSDQPFYGNPAAVCLLQTATGDSWLQSVAGEVNLSETAFVQPHDDGFELRWFTPSTEVNLCGHATLAAAHILWENGYLANNKQARFHTRSGLLSAQIDNNNIALDFPATPAEAVTPPMGLLAALGLTTGDVFSNKVDYLVQLDDEALIHKLEPDFAALATIETRGVIVTALSSDHAYDFVSRFFAPAAGINEDPVTGSAHCTLAPFWAERLNKKSLRAYQASHRGGEVGMRLQGDRVYLSGKAITIMEGVLYV